MNFYRQKGTNTVEFAIVGLVVFLFLFGSIEVGRLLFTMNTLTTVTRNAARVAAVCPVNEPMIRQIAIFGNGGDTSAILPRLTVDNIALNYYDENGVSTLSYDEIEFVNATLTGYTHIFIVPTAGATLTLPALSTTLPAESMGWVPEDNSRYCM